MQNQATEGYPNRSEGRVIYVVDDDLDLRRSLHFMLETRQICVSPFASGIAFLNELANLAPAPVILDVRMPRIDGIEVLSELASSGNTWPVIVLTGHGDVAIAVEAIKLGAIDFLEKPIKSDELLELIEKAFSLLASGSSEAERRASALQRLSVLTPRESEVVKLLCSGLLNKQVASRMSISPRTVEMHRAKALRQLNVRTLVEAVTIRNTAGLND